MLVLDIAAGGGTEHAGRSIGILIGTLMFPASGLVLLIIGARKRSQHRRPPQPGPYPPGYPYPPAYPYPPGYPPTPGYPVALPTGARRSSSGSALMAVGAVLLALGALGLLGRLSRAEESGTVPLQIGQCVTESDYESHSFTTPTACGDPAAIFELATKAGPSATCPDENRTEGRYTKAANSSTTLCFIPNLREGQCFAGKGPQPGGGSSTSCTNPANNLKIVKRLDDSFDVTGCPAGSKAILYPLPPRVYCVAATPS